MYRDAQRFNQSSVSHRDGGWQSEATLFRNSIVRGQCTIVRRRRRKLHVSAKVVSATPAILAGLARDAWLNRDPVTDIDRFDTLAARYNDACGFMTEYDGFLYFVWPDPSMLPIMNLQRWILVLFFIFRPLLRRRGRGRLTSDPHTPVAIIRTMTCFGSWMVGTALSSYVNDRSVPSRKVEFRCRRRQNPAKSRGQFTHHLSV